MKAIVNTKNDESIELEYNTWGDVRIEGEKDYNPSKKFFQNLKSGEELVTDMQKMV